MILIYTNHHNTEYSSKTSEQDEDLCRRESKPSRKITWKKYSLNIEGKQFNGTTIKWYKMLPTQLENLKFPLSILRHFFDLIEGIVEEGNVYNA